MDENNIEVAEDGAPVVVEEEATEVAPPPADAPDAAEVESEA